MYLKTFFVLTAIVLVKSDCDGSDECLSDPNKHKLSDTEDNKHKMNANSDENDSNDNNNKPPELIQFNNNLDKTLSKVFKDVSSLVEDELKEVFGVKQDINLHKKFDEKTQIHLRAYTLSDKDKFQPPLFNSQDVKLPVIARSNNITKLNDELSSLKVQVEKSIERELEDFILKVIENEALDWIAKELGDIPAAPSTRKTTPKPVTIPYPKVSKLSTTTLRPTPKVLTTVLTTTTSRPASFVSISTSPTVPSNIVTQKPITVSKVPDIPEPEQKSSLPVSYPSQPSVTTSKSHIITENPVATPKAPISPIPITTKTIPASSSSPKPIVPQDPSVITPESIVTAKILTKSHVTATIASKKTTSSKLLSTLSSFPSTTTTVPLVNTIVTKVNGSGISKSTANTKNIPDEKKYKSSSELPPVPAHTETVLINATIEMDEDIDIEPDSPEIEPSKSDTREGILNINLIKDNEILDEEYYEIPDDNSTDYPIIDYVEMYKDTTNENRVFKPTNVPETEIFRPKINLENDIYNETVYTQDNETHNLTAT